MNIRRKRKQRVRKVFVKNDNTMLHSCPYSFLEAEQVSSQIKNDEKVQFVCVFSVQTLSVINSFTTDYTE